MADLLFYCAFLGAWMLLIAIGERYPKFTNQVQKLMYGERRQDGKTYIYKKRGYIRPVRATKQRQSNPNIYAVRQYA